MWIEHTRPSYGTVRIVTKFLFLPKKEYNHETRKESTRWLETASWHEVYTRGKFGDFWKFKEYIK